MAWTSDPVHPLPIVEVSFLDGMWLVEHVQRHSFTINATIDPSIESNDWKDYSESLEFGWSWFMPSLANTYICGYTIHKFFVNIKRDHLPKLDAILLIVETLGNGLRGVIGASMALSAGTAFSFPVFLWLLFVNILINVLGNFALGMALQDVYALIHPKVTTTPTWFKIAVFGTSVPMIIAHTVLNVIPMSRGDRARGLGFQYAWAGLLIGTCLFFVVYAIKISRLLQREVIVSKRDHIRSLKLARRLQLCAIFMVLDMIVLGILAVFAWRNTPRTLFMSISFAAWSACFTSSCKLRALVEPIHVSDVDSFPFDIRVSSHVEEIQQH